MNTMLSLARQKDQTIVFAGMTLRAVDVGVVMNVDEITMKEPPRLQMAFERAEVRELAELAWRKFGEMRGPAERKRKAVVFSDELYGRSWRARSRRYGARS